MKMKKIIASGFALALLSTLNPQLSTAFAQGSLTPPGAPAPTMKSLDQIDAKLEKRTPISSLPITITQPGAYYLTSSFDLGTGQDGIFVSALNVTIDLNGFTIRSFDSGNTAVGIRIDPMLGYMANLTILNGHIVGGVLFSSGSYFGSGFGYGIYCSGSPRNVRIVGVTVSGCLNDVINIGNNATLVESCTVSTVGGNGIVANAVSRCTAYQCGMSGIWGYSVSDSYGDSTIPPFAGIHAHIANNSYGSGVGSGFFAGAGLVADAANNCYGYNNGSPAGGLGVSAGTANNCYGYGDGAAAGLYATTALNCYGYAAGSASGIYVFDVASGCSGYSSSGTGLYAFIANVCHGSTSTGTPLSVTHNVNSY
jgi:hypothetical protein